MNWDFRKKIGRAAAGVAMRPPMAVKAESMYGLPLGFMPPPMPAVVQPRPPQGNSLPSAHEVAMEVMKLKANGGPWPTIREKDIADAAYVLSAISRIIDRR